MQDNKVQKSRDLPMKQPHSQSPVKPRKVSFIINCYEEKKVSLLAEEYLLTDKPYYVSFSIEQLQNHKIYVMYITSYRLHFMCTVDTEIVTVPHAYLREWQVYDNEIRFVLKTGIRCFLVPVQENETNDIFENLMLAQKSIPFCLQVKFPEQQPQIYDCLAEMQRMLINWKKVVAIDNMNGKIVPTYPKIIFVPFKVEKEVVKQSQQSRQNSRIPAMTYFSRQYGVGVWRCGHTIKQQYNKYDYAYLEAISQNLLIIELQELQSRRQSNYSFNHFNNQIKHSIQKFETLYNVRMNYEKVIQAYVRDQSQTLWRAVGKWYQELDVLIKAAFKACEQIKSKRPILIQENSYSKTENGNGLQFSKGCVDRASQICALIQVILDPYYRSIKGFSVLVQKQFLSFGYPFKDRCCLSQVQPQLTSLTKSRQQPTLSSLYRQLSRSPLKQQISPTFIQFLQCVSQFINCFPQHFEYSPEYLAQVGYELFSGKYNNFLFNSIHEKTLCSQAKNTQSLYQHMGVRKGFYNLQFYPQAKAKNLIQVRGAPNVKEYLLWKEYWDMVTQMNCAEKKGEDSLQIAVFRKLIHEKKEKCKKKQ